MKASNPVIIDRIVGFLERHAATIGAFYGIISDPVYSVGWEGAIKFMMDRLMMWKPPDIGKIFSLLTTLPPYAGPFKGGIMSMIAGWLMKEFGGELHPSISRLGAAVQSLGMGTTLGSVIGAFLWLPALDPPGESGPSGIRSGRGW